MKKMLYIIIPTVIITSVLLIMPIVSGFVTADVEYIYPTIEDVYNYAVCNGVISEENGVLSVTANISEHDIPRVREGQSVIITGSALGDTEHFGKVTSIATKATKQQSGGSSRTVLKCNIEFESATNDLKSGYNVTARIITNVTESAVVVPFDNCIIENGNYYVYLLQGNSAQRRLVDVSDETESGFVISSGVTSESMLICSPEKLEGSQVRVNAKAFGAGY